ncbi:hypothetical protein TNCV_2083411 [Trichonephila clavipes]|nr:hypothetical protein TNCV_2083411 [Trichonephila clavipes]
MVYIDVLRRIWPPITVERAWNTRYEQKFVCENDRYGPDVMVGLRIMHNDRTPLLIFDRGSVSSQRYCRESILDHVHIYRGVENPDFLFIDDNMRPHRSVKSEVSPAWTDLTCISPYSSPGTIEGGSSMAPGLVPWT